MDLITVKDPKGEPYSISICKGSLISGAQGETSKATLGANQTQIVTKTIRVSTIDWPYLRSTLDIEQALKDRHGSCGSRSTAICFVGVAGHASHRDRFNPATPYFTVDGDETSVIHLLYRYISGVDLVDYLTGSADGKVKPKPMSHSMIRQLLEAVALLHGNNIVHRDLKLENIRIEPDDNVRLIDFGEACSVGACTFEKPIGTLLYLPPESYSLLPKAMRIADLPSLPEADLDAIKRDPRCIDMFSVGAILFASVKGQQLIPYLYGKTTADPFRQQDLQLTGSFMTNIYPKIYNEYFGKMIAWLGSSGDRDGQHLFMLIKGLVDPNYNSRLTAAAALALFDKLFPPSPPPAEKGGRRRGPYRRGTRRPRQQQQQRQQQRQQQQRQRQRQRQQQQTRKSFQI